MCNISISKHYYLHSILVRFKLNREILKNEIKKRKLKKGAKKKKRRKKNERKEKEIRSNKFSIYIYKRLSDCPTV